MDLQTAASICRPINDPVERLYALSAGWAPAMRRRLFGMRERFDAADRAGRIDICRLAARNLNAMVANIDEGGARAANTLAFMKRDDVSVVDLAVAADAFEACALDLEGADR